ncbi:MAG: hypothetical protein JXA75_00625 [Candidatus Thermoplasmatota archaeon]|nr:hypothetical protein [Candidatus Thermoplasmatota archaeon]
MIQGRTIERCKHPFPRGALNKIFLPVINLFASKGAQRWFLRTDTVPSREINTIAII